MLAVMYYMYRHIIQPFHSFDKMATALSRQDFTYEIKVQKTRYFSNFLWALDMMKEELHHRRKKEIKLMKDKKTLIVSISHDIKTPLANIRLNNASYEQNLYTKEVVLARIEENCAKIETYITQIMKVSVEDLFDFHMHCKEYYLEQVHQEIVEANKERMKFHLIDVNIKAYDNQIIVVDNARLKEVIDNIFDNARKYGDGTRVDVRFYEEDYRMIICITNSGEVMGSQDVMKCFQSFYRGRNAQHEKGNGLGLYICKTLMRAMGGDIFITQAKHQVSVHLVLANVYDTDVHNAC